MLLFDARGTLLSRTKANEPEMTLSTGDGFFLVVLAIGKETRHIKVLH